MRFLLVLVVINEGARSKFGPLVLGHVWVRVQLLELKPTRLVRGMGSRREVVVDK